MRFAGLIPPMRAPGTANLVILTAGAILVGYILLLISVGFIGQNKLRAAISENIRADLEKQADALSYFFSERIDDVLSLALDRSVSTYFTNKALGMSMEYGLRSSLLAVRSQLVAVRDRKTIREQSAFHDVAFLQLDGVTLARTRLPDLMAPGSSECELSEQPAVIVSNHPNPQPRILVCATVFHKERPVGYIVGDINFKAALEHLLSGYAEQDKPKLSLYGPGGEQLSNQRDNTLPANVDSAAQEFRFPVEGTSLALLATQSAVEQYRYITSPWLLAALLLMALPVLIGVFFLLRFNSHNLVLQTRFEAARMQHEELQVHNRRLQNEISKRVEFERRLAHQANFDDLTSLPNRNLALDRLSQSIKRARRNTGKILLMFIDLDHFKQVNDSLGHQAGDKLLREASARLTEAVRDSDTVARLGGDEFLLICPDVPGPGPAESLAENVLEALNPPFHVDNQEFFVRASIGLAIYPDDGDTPEQLLKNSDVALYRAKDEGRNRFCFFTHAMDAAAKQRLVLESHLRHAIEQDELRLVYQPMIDLADGRVIALEALLRWQSDTLGEVSPSEFIPLAEDTGIIHDLTRWALHQACSQMARLGDEQVVRVAVNISPKEFVNPERFMALVEECVKDSGLLPERLELELTEGMLVHDHPATSNTLDYLDKQHIRLSVDDFGTGYSALSYLQKFPFDTLKIDRSFVQGIEEKPASAALVRAILVMAKALGLETVAEGVETGAQARFLALHGCRYAQGFMFSAPIAADRVREFLVSANAPAA